MKRWKLKLKFGPFRAGYINEDTEFPGWEQGGMRFDKRGSIAEGEFAMLLDYARDAKLTSILEEA